MEVSEADKTNNGGQPKRSKKPRKRMKSTFAKIRDQMEFYFGDVNLNKDRFMKKIIDENPEGYVDLELFLKFNKIAALTDDVKVIVDSLMYKSTMLEVNEDRTKVRRTTPVCVPKNIDERTVYVECLPHNINHEWVKRLFSACGKVAYVSLPRYPSSRDLKGFAFVEFETVEGAAAACQELNNPPVDMTEERVGMFPKSSHQLDALKKKLPEDQVKETEEKVKEILVQGKEGEEGKDIKENLDLDKTSSNNPSVPHKRQRSASENSTECPTPTKRKKSDNQAETNQASDTDKSMASGSKKKSRKRKSRSKTCESTPQESDVGKSDCEVDRSVQPAPEKKQKLNETVAIGETVSDKVEQSNEQSTQNDKENDAKKKKKRLRKKKEKKEKEIPELRVIPKKEWLKLREEYLELQKTNMKLLKQTLNEKINEENKEKEDKKKKKEIQFVADVIVKVVSEEPVTRKTLKEQFKEDIQIAYLDINDGLCEGFIRCKNAESATRLLTTSVDKVTFNLITGEEEKQYWDKLTSDRETKLTTKSRSKKRGHQKLMDKAQKSSLETTERKHIVFDDE